MDGASLRQVGDGFGFPEGPVMLPDGYLVFSDIANDALVRFTRPGRTGIFRQPSGGANGNTLDPRGRLVTCEAGRRRVTRTEPDGAITVLAAHHEGKRLNAPNDVVVRSDGAVYFTDPIFLGPDEGLLAPSYMALGFCGVFRIAPDGGLTPLTTELARPNGLAFSPDESRLYVVDSADNSVSAFDVAADGTLRNRRQWLAMRHAAEGVGDGMKVDVDGPRLRHRAGRGLGGGPRRDAARHPSPAGGRDQRGLLRLRREDPLRHRAAGPVRGPARACRGSRSSIASAEPCPGRGARRARLDRGARGHGARRPGGNVPDPGQLAVLPRSPWSEHPRRCARLDPSRSSCSTPPTAHVSAAGSCGATPAPAGLVVYYGGNAEEVSWQAREPGWPADWSLALVNYRGYGASEGKPSERSLFADALVVFDALARRPDVDASRIVLFGRSLGSAVAVHVAAERPVAGVVLVSPFASMVEVGRHHYPWLPVGLLLRHRFDARSRAPAITVPLLAIVGARDGIIPPGHSRRLFDAWSGPKRWVAMADADHNDVGASPGFWAVVAAFLSEPRAGS